MTYTTKKKMERIILKQMALKPHPAAGYDDDDAYTRLILINETYTFKFPSLSDSQFLFLLLLFHLFNQPISRSLTFIYSSFLLFIFRPFFQLKSCYSFHFRVKQASLTRGYFTMDVTLYSNVYERFP
jgi:hypothetical protein